MVVLGRGEGREGVFFWGEGLQGRESGGGALGVEVGVGAEPFFELGWGRGGGGEGEVGEPEG